MKFRHWIKDRFTEGKGARLSVRQINHAFTLAVQVRVGLDHMHWNEFLEMLTRISRSLHPSSSLLEAVTELCSNLKKQWKIRSVKQMKQTHAKNNGWFLEYLISFLALRCAVWRRLSPTRLSLSTSFYFLLLVLLQTKCTKYVLHCLA